MIKSRNSNSLVIVLHEIYGVNQHIIETVDKYRQMGFDAVSPDLLELDRPYSYHEEQAAYRNYMQKVSFPKAAGQIQELADHAKKAGYHQVVLLGFSAGATVAWLCSRSNSIDGVICYYGSRIRDYCDISPLCPTLLIFPTYEKAYDVVSFAASIKKDKVETKIYVGNHGFSDRFSPAYNPPSSSEAEALVQTFLKKLAAASENM